MVVPCDGVVFDWPPAVEELPVGFKVVAPEVCEIADDPVDDTGEVPEMVDEVDEVSRPELICDLEETQVLEAITLLDGLGWRDVGVLDGTELLGWRVTVEIVDVRITGVDLVRDVTREVDGLGLPEVTGDLEGVSVLVAFVVADGLG